MAAVRNCYATGAAGGSAVGGLVGLTKYEYSSPQIAYSYALGQVSGGPFSGGLIGKDEAINT